MSHAISLERLGIGSRMPSYARMDLLPCACKNARSISPLPHKTCNEEFRSGRPAQRHRRRKSRRCLQRHLSLIRNGGEIAAGSAWLIRLAGQSCRWACVSVVGDPQAADSHSFPPSLGGNRNGATVWPDDSVVMVAALAPGPPVHTLTHILE